MTLQAQYSRQSKMLIVLSYLPCLDTCQITAALTGGHCTNADTANFDSGLLSYLKQLRNTLIKQLVASGLKKFKVLDTCCTANTLAALRTARDGILFGVAAGYKHVAERSIQCLKSLLTSPKQPIITSTHFWSGFRSTKGLEQHRVTAPACRVRRWLAAQLEASMPHFPIDKALCRALWLINV